MRVVKMNELAVAMKQTTLPIVILFWNPIDLRYEEWRQHALRLTEEYVGRVEVLAVEMNEELSTWWEALRCGIPTPYVQTNFQLPTLMIIRTEEERACQPGIRPGFVDRHRFLPQMANMFGQAAVRQPHMDLL